MNRNMRFLILLASIGGLLLRAQTPIQISVNQARPLEAALDQLENKLGIPINYEDPRLACPSDIQDVTAQVQNAAQRAANPRTRVIVPKGGALSVDMVLPNVVQTGDALTVVTALRAQYEANGYPGRFTIKQVGSVLTVEPNAVRGSDCTWAAASPAMETPISFPSQQRDATETLSLILHAVTQRLGMKVGLGNLPMVAFVNRKATVRADNEPANIVLMRLFDQLSPAGQSTYSYHLFYDPGLKYYLADIAAVQPLRPKPEAQGVPPPPKGVFGASQNPPKK
ncbi:MAG TPA: hypothetical protein VE994_11675 [Terriglobales bacterium]|jgi:hypothetical protein|nr:hypothetical protein [Terriglobales bacterium]